MLAERLLAVHWLVKKSAAPPHAWLPSLQRRFSSSATRRSLAVCQR